jgi:competence protein ComEC
MLLLAGCGSRTGAGGPDPAGTAPGASGPVTASVSGELRVSFLDVGQGDSALIQTPGGEEVLIDGGPYEAGPRVIEALRGAGVRQIDLLLGTHPHEDHIGGLMDVLREVPVKQALDPGYAHGTSLQRKYLELLKEKGVKTTRARRGQSYDLHGGVRLDILAPDDPLIKGTSADANNNSIVARLTYGSTAFLFTGDMEEEERGRLTQSVSPASLRAEVLKVAHHGSHNGTDREFLQLVQPRYAVISLARGNDYGHPHREAIEALEQSGAQILRTDQRGTIVFTSNGSRVQLQGAPAPAAPAARNATPQAQVIGNEESHVYHAPDCPRLPARDKRVTFNSAAEAMKAGYHPHAACTRGSGRP